MKYLVDTPEVIWGCLDSRQWLAAAQRLQRASQANARHCTLLQKILSAWPMVAVALHMPASSTGW